eukprot:1877196-Ditylum_brightwellii.AAC.1
MEAAKVLKQLSSKLAKKWECLISQASNYVHTTISISNVRATNGCLHRICVALSVISTCCFHCTDDAGISLLQSEAG